MTELRKFTMVGFKVTWKLLDIGFRRCRCFAGSLSSETIINYAQSQLEKTEDEQVLMLAIEHQEETEAVDKYLCALAQKENTSYELEFRKWRVLYVKDNLPKDNEDAVTGLMQLYYIWAKFDFPDDSPHIVEGMDNSITPKEYYTEENYKKLLRKNQTWANNEMDVIRKIQDQLLRPQTIAS
jgi:hypothetical protein